MSETSTVRVPQVVTLTAALATATVALLLLNALGGVGTALTTNRAPVSAWRFAGFAQLLAAMLALVGWRLAPRATWPILIGLGALLSIPRFLGVVAPDLLVDLPAVPLLVALSVAPAVLLIGLLGIGSWLAQVGRGDLAGALIGITAVAQGTSVFVYSAFSGDPFLDPDLEVWLGIVLAAIGMIGAIVLVVVVPTVQGGDAAPRRPSWRVTAAGLVAVAVSALPLVVNVNDFVSTTGADALNLTAVGRYYLVMGLIVLGAGLAAAMIAGPRVLLAAVTVSLAAAAVGVTAPLYGVEPGAVAAGVLTGLAGGFLLSIAESRVRLAVLTSAVAGVGVLVVWLVVRGTVPVYLSSVLIVLALAGGVAAVAAVTGQVALRSAAPAVVGGCAVALQVALPLLAYAARVTVSGDPAERPLDPVVGASAVMLLAVAGLILLSMRLDRRAQPAEPEPEPVLEPEPEVGADEAR